MHVHIISGDGEANFWLEPDLELAKYHGYNRQQLKGIESLVEDHPMSLSALGNSASAVEVTNISTHGVWLLAHDREFFMPYNIFPWFKEQRVGAILNVKEQSPGHFYWPELDVDLTEEIIEHPDRFPNVAQNT